MERFAAIFWDSASAQGLATATSWRAALVERAPCWRIALEAADALVLMRPRDRPSQARVVPLSTGDGVVIGPIFSRAFTAAGPIERFPAKVERALMQSGGRTLTGAHWGDYVAIWRDDASWRITRDPCGAQPCFLMRANGADLCFAHPGDIAHLPGLSFSIDWRFIAAHLQYGYFATRRTGLAEVEDVLAGARYTRTSSGWTHDWLWRADALARDPHRLSFAEAANETLQIASNVCAGWTRAHRRVVASLSGGLDSSAMIALLARQERTDVIALHYRGIDYEAYETDLARLAAHETGVRLAEVTQDPRADSLWRNANSDLLARPRKQALAVLVDDIAQSLADETGAEAFMIGQGGDNLFLQGGGAHWLVRDALHAGAAPRALAKAVTAAARLQLQPYSKIVAQALLMQRRAPYGYLARLTGHTLVTPDAAAAIADEDRMHPWLVTASDLAPGKAEQLELLVALYNYHIHFGRGLKRDVVFPLFSSPMFEFALRTPTPLLAHGGVDRALERAAFAEIIPNKVRRRTAKGLADRYLHSVLVHNAGDIRRTLREGPLWDAPLFNRTEAERMLNALDQGVTQSVNNFFVLLAVDTWLRAWFAAGARL